MASTVITQALFFIIIFIFFIFVIAASSNPESENNGLSFEIIPMHPSMKPSSSNDVGFPFEVYDGYYYAMKLRIGSNGFETSAFINTGNDLTWTQCLPCYNCSAQSTPMFDPAASHTYSNVSCTSPSCQPQGGTIDQCLDGACIFRHMYGPHRSSVVNGVLGQDTMTVVADDGKDVSFNLLFGCGHHHDVTGSFLGGSVGLGRGPWSLVSQLKSAASGRFSYCFNFFDDEPAKSVLNFGLRARVTGEGVVTLPMSIVQGNEWRYYLTLNDISIGTERLNIPPGTFVPSSSGEGGLYIDSGTPFTYLKQVAYDMLKDTLESDILSFPIAAAGTVPGFDLCFNATANDILFSFPDATFHFLGGDVILGPWNLFVDISDNACLAVFPVANDAQSIYGNIMQQGFHVGYDLNDNTLSLFHADGCRKM